MPARTYNAVMNALVHRGKSVFVGTLPFAVAALLFLVSSSGRERGLAFNTLALIFGTLAISLPLGTVLAVLIARTDMPGRGLFRLVITVLLFMPLYVQTAAWQAGFGLSGWATLMLSGFGSEALLSGWRGAIWIHALAAIPWVTTIVALAMRQIEPQLEEAAMLTGTTFQVIWHVTLRRSARAVLSAAAWVAMMTAGEFTVTDMWWIRTYAEDIFRGFSVGESLEEVSFGLLPSVTAIGLLILASLLVCRRWMTESFRLPARDLWTFRLGKTKWVWFAFVLLVMLGLLGVPLLNLLVNLGIEIQVTSAGTMRQWSASLAVHSFLSSVVEFRREMIWSLLTSAVASTAALFVATTLAWWGRRMRVVAAFTMLLFAVLLATPGPLLSLWLVWMMNVPNAPWWNLLVDRSIFAPTVALALRAFPISLLLMWFTVRSVPQAVIDSATLDGAGPLRILLLLALPMRKTAIIGTWLVGLAVALGDLSTSFLVLPPGASPLSRRIFEEVHYGVPGRIAGITLVAMVMVTIIVLASDWLFSGRRNSDYETPSQ